ncbi:ATP-binding protein [Candidatus Parcubacteria bacterium]|nr:ATP-binding protein [Patescibacteria group bacterium]MCG2690486.1 ATP-binding protein [Candidatus Parcubacteria bacterium]
MKENEYGLEFLIRYNPWWLNKSEIDQDLKITQFQQSVVKYYHPLLDKFATDKDAVYTLRGPRQTGKSTILKLLIKRLLEEKKNPRGIFFFPGDYIKDYKELYEILLVFLNSVSKRDRKYVFIDEISFIKEWTRAIKLLADEGKLKNCFVLLTGSLSIFVKGESEFMPGRRGKVKYLDKILFPLSFGEYIKLIDKNLFDKIKTEGDITDKLNNQPDINKNAALKYSQHNNILNKHWLDYILTGGYFLNINSYLSDGRLPASNYNLYLESFRGDWLKLGREEFLLKETIMGIIKQLGSSTSWLNLAKQSSAQSHLTMAGSVEILEKLFIVKVLHNLDIDKKLPNLRKEKKIFFIDPFVFTLLSGYVQSKEEYLTIYKDLIKNYMPNIVENAVASHLSRFYKSCFFYRTKAGEIDFVGQIGGDFVGYEVKYQNLISKEDFKFKDKFKNIFLVSKNKFDIQKNHLAFPFLWLLVNLDKSYREEN